MVYLHGVLVFMQVCKTGSCDYTNALTPVTRILHNEVWTRKNKMAAVGM